MTTEEIKAKYGEVYELIVKDSEGNDVKAYLRKPARPVMSVIMSKVASDPLGSMETLLRNCIIADVSDMRVLEDDEMFYSAVPALQELIAIRESSLKKI
jgi:hypothetical protein